MDRACQATTLLLITVPATSLSRGQRRGRRWGRLGLSYQKLVGSGLFVSSSTGSAVPTLVLLWSFLTPKASRLILLCD